jgi:hypothetical protein
MSGRVPCPVLTVQQILAWADAHHERTGRWPTRNSGPVPEAPGETWERLNCALSEGCRGLPGGDSLSRLLDRQRRKRASRHWGRWTPAEDELVRSLPPEEVARRTRRNLLSVHVRRYELGMPDVLSG